jgi:hypothetical protein
MGTNTAPLAVGQVDAGDFSLLYLNRAIWAIDPADHAVGAPVHIDNRTMRTPAPSFIFLSIAGIGD